MAGPRASEQLDGFRIAGPLICTCLAYLCHVSSVHKCLYWVFSLAKSSELKRTQ